MIKPFAFLVALGLGVVIPGKPVPDDYTRRKERLTLVCGRLYQAYRDQTTSGGSIAALRQQLALHLIPAGKGDSARCIYYVPGRTPGIDIMEEVMAHCESYGAKSEDALACLLGHEMAHHVHQHGRKNLTFVPVSIRGASLHSTKNLEAIADRSGVFAAYFAGYDAFTIAPKIYDDIYSVFLHNKEPAYYLPRNKRIQLVSDQAIRVREMAHWCELAEFFYVSQDYQAADDALSEVLARYPAPFIKNNLGAVKLNHALLLMGTLADDPVIRYAFPVEYDAGNRLLSSPRRGKAQDYIRLLADARRLFEGILQDNPQHETARINLSIVHLLSHRAPLAKEVLLPLLYRFNPVSPNGNLLMGITEAELKNGAMATRFLAKARQLGAWQAGYNLAMANASGKTLRERILLRFFRKPDETAVDAKPVPELPETSMEKQKPDTLGRLAGVAVTYRYHRNTAVYRIAGYLRKPATRYIVRKSTALAIPELPFGSTVAQLLSRFRQPSRDLPGARGTRFLVYDQDRSGIFLEFRDNRLIGWTDYEAI